MTRLGLSREAIGAAQHQRGLFPNPLLRLRGGRLIGEDQHVPAFRKPSFDFAWNAADEIKALRNYPKLPDKEDRAIPTKQDNRLLLVTWNIANLGLQQRRQKDYQLIAEILGWFDLAAIQEVNGNLDGLEGIRRELPKRYQVVFSDPGGNNERFAFLFDSEKVEPLEEVGEVTIPPADLKDVKLPDISQTFQGFDRNPYLASLRAGKLTFSLADVHLYFGDEKEKTGMDRRCLEAYAVARWADLRHRDDHAYTSNILALGDFNLPVRDETAPVFQALTRRGLHLPQHSTKVGGSNLSDDAQYDQMAVFPGPMENALAKKSNGQLVASVFDFDNAVFRKLWGETKAQQSKFRSYVKYYLSDHRPLWAQLRI